MRWIVLVLSMVSLAGCMDGGVQEETPVLVIQPESAARDDPTYTFVLYGTPVNDGDHKLESKQDLDLRIFVGGDAFPDHIVEWTAEPGDKKQALAIYRVHQPDVYFDAYVDGERAVGASLDLSTCPHGDGDADFRVMEPPPAYYSKVEINFGCSS